MNQRIPTFFAIAAPNSRRVWLYDANCMPSAYHDDNREAVRVRPSGRFARWVDDHPGFLMDDGDRSDWMEQTAFIVDRPPRRHGGYRFDDDDWTHTQEVPMRWHFAGATIYSMLCPDPIPVIAVEHPEALPATMLNEMRMVPATRVIYRAWRQRWDPYVVEREIEAIAAPPPPAAPIAPPPPPPAAPVATAPLPKFVADALVRDAAAADAICPITMEPITIATAAVTSCFHVFDANAIAIWLVDHRTCPTCKQVTSVTPSPTA